MEKKVQWSETLVKSNSATHRASWKHSQHRRSSIDYATLLKKGMARVWERMVDLISSTLQVAKGASTRRHRWAIVSPRNPRASPDAWRSGVLKEIALKTSVLITSHFSCKITWNHHNPPTNHSQIIASVHTKPRLNEKKKILGPTKGSSRRLGKVPWAGRRRKRRKAPGVTPLEEGAGWHLGTFLRLAICFSPKWLGGGGLNLTDLTRVQRRGNIAPVLQRAGPPRNKTPRLTFTSRLIDLYKNPLRCLDAFSKTSGVSFQIHRTTSIKTLIHFL